MLPGTSTASAAPSQATVFIVDDDPAMLRLLGAELEHAGLRAKAFGSARDFLACVTPHDHGCLLLDIDMPTMTGTELQVLLAEKGIRLPIIFLSGTADVPTTATVMKRGAVDLIEKPCEPAVLLKAVRSAIEADGIARNERTLVDELCRRANTLTNREREVAELVVQGLANKQIAATLGVSVRTVEIHRGRVMSKMQADSIAELVTQWREIGKFTAESQRSQRKPVN